MKVNSLNAQLYLAHNLKQQDFHNGDTPHAEWWYFSEAENKINRMTNMELLDLIGELMESDDT